jgi:hypothetical protein
MGAITAPVLYAQNDEQDVFINAEEINDNNTQTETVQTLDSIINSLSEVAVDDAVPVIVVEEEDSDLIDPDFLMDEGDSYDDFPIVSVRILDKITADTNTFDLNIGKTVAFGSIRIRPMACKKAPPIEEPESASFLQLWEKDRQGKSEWIFSGWMFASSPSLSAMEHPIYDVWVIDCKGKISDEESNKVGEEDAIDETTEN